MGEKKIKHGYVFVQHASSAYLSNQLNPPRQDKFVSYF